MMKEKKNGHFSPFQSPGENVYSTNVLFLKKREVDLQLVSFNFRQSIEITDLIKLPENRYFVYKKSPFAFGNAYSFSFKTENQEEASLSVRKKRFTLINSLKEHYFLKNDKKLRRARLLYSSFSNLKFSALGQLRNRKLGPRIKKKRKQIRLRIKKFFRPLLSLCAYGYLSNLYQVSLPLPVKKRGKRKMASVHSKKINFYLKRKKNLQFLPGLKKQKRDLFHYLIHGQKKKEEEVSIQKKNVRKE